MRTELSEAKYLNLTQTINAYSSLCYNWDGYDGDKPDTKTIASAIQFCDALKKYHISAPKCMVSGDGNISLFWDRDDVYIEISFDYEGKYSFLIKKLNDLYCGKDDCILSDTQDNDLLIFLAQNGD